MGRLILAFKLFFKVLFDKAIAGRAARIFEPAPADSAMPTASPAPAPATRPSPAVSTRSDALTLLALLQREARLIDFLKEEITAYNDAQIGAAVRDVHRDAAAALERLFALRPVFEQTEGTEVAIPSTPDAARMRIVGNLAGQAPTRGRLQHGGWQATKIELPQFTGGGDSTRIITLAEVEV